MAGSENGKLEPILTSILRILAVQTVEGKKLTEAVKLLDRAGLDSNAIADVCETSPNSVRARLSQARKERKMKKEEGKTE